MFEDFGSVRFNRNFNAMEQVEKIEFVRELKNKFTKFEEELIKGLARKEGQMEIEYNA